MINSHNRKKKMSAQSEFENLVEFLSESHAAVAGQMFGKKCIKIGSKAGIALFENCLVFKLKGGGDVHHEAISLEGSQLWDPSGKGRAMKEWVQVKVEHQSYFQEFATAAANYVS